MTYRYCQFLGGALIGDRHLFQKSYFLEGHSLERGAYQRVVLIRSFMVHSKRTKNKVSISDLITEIYLHGIVNLRLHVQFFPRDGNAISRNYCIAIMRKKLHVQHVLHWQCNIF